MIVSCEASSKFHRRSLQNDRFVRGFLQISQNKLPKRAFRARLPPNFIEQMLPKGSFRARLPTIFHRKFAFRHSFVQSTHRILRKGSFIQQKQNVRIATTACYPKFQNARFTTAACAKIYESSDLRPRQPAAYKNQHFTTVSDV